MPEPTHAAGHGTKVHASKATWRYYKERKLSVTDVFRLLRPFWKKGKCGVGDNEKWVAIVQWLKERGLLPKGSKASKIWGKKVRMLEKVNPGKVDFERVLPVEDIEEWAHQKKARILELRQMIVDRADERGMLESDMEALALALVLTLALALTLTLAVLGPGGARGVPGKSRRLRTPHVHGGGGRRPYSQCGDQVGPPRGGACLVEHKME